ncbi:MAG: rhomboid family intramembrane serine protease [Bacteroidetes bacterium]|nr:rhomboid family intramembrane serine protease [Bacteroidota bacterium]
MHTNWNHLIFNMLSLYFFSGPLENQVGGLNFLLIYFTSLIARNLFALIIHKNHGDYCAVGASGAICGIIFASIALFPSMEIGLLLLPFSVPGWLFGILYIAYTFSKRKKFGQGAPWRSTFLYGQFTFCLKKIPTIILILLCCFYQND